MAVLKKTKHDVICEFRCAEILDAARKVFARKGFEGATVDEIAEAAGVAKGTVYLYFPSKREIYLEALRRGVAGLVEQTNRNMDAAPAAAEKIRAFITTRVRYAEENRDFMAIYHAEFGQMQAACINKGFRALFLRQAKAIEAIMRQAVEEGQIRAVPPDAASFLIYDATRGIVTRRLLGLSKRTAEEDTELAFDLIWEGLAPG